MRDFSFSGYGFLPFGKTDKGEREVSLKEQLIERLERRFKEHQASLRFITVGSLAMALSACKRDQLNNKILAAVQKDNRLKVFLAE